MNTTGLVVEVLAVGLTGLCWLALAAICVGGQRTLDLLHAAAGLQRGAVILVPLIFSVGYAVGVILNRVSDWVMWPVDALLRQRFFGRSPEESLVRWRQAQMAILKHHEQVWTRLDRGRSLVRMTRSGFLNFLLSGALLPYALWRLGVLWEYYAATGFLCTSCMILAIASYVSWRRLTVVDFELTRFAVTEPQPTVARADGSKQPEPTSGMTLERSVQAIVFSLRTEGPCFLVMKRTDDRGGFWQSVTGGIKEGESVIDAAIREVQEETGVAPLCVWPLQHTHEFAREERLPSGQKTYTVSFEQSVGVQVAHDVQVSLDPREHVAYEWLSAKKALTVIKYETNARALQELADKVENQLICQQASAPDAGGGGSPG